MPSNGESIATTPGHPFATTQHGNFVFAGDLPLKTPLQEFDGHTVRLASETRQNGPTPIFNFEVEDFHTYFVGKSKLWVHNISLQNGVQLDQRAVDHIVERHWPGAGTAPGAAPAGHFNPNTRLRDVVDMLNDTLAHGTSRPNTNGRPGRIFEYTFQSFIGSNTVGNATRRMRVTVIGRRVVTAFPY